DEFNSRYLAEGEEPREPVMVRRTSTLRPQHRRGGRRRGVFAPPRLGALVAVTIPAWEVSGPDNQAIPHPRTTTAQVKKPLKSASPTKPAKTAPVSFRLYVRAVHGNCWMDVRNWSASGKSRYTGTVELGQDQRWVSRRLWINF